MFPTTSTPSDDRAAQQGPRCSEEAGLETDARMPLLGVVSRLVKEKGFDIAAPAVKRWLDLGGQFVLLGTGEATSSTTFAQIEIDYPRPRERPPAVRRAVCPPDLRRRGRPADPVALRAVRPGPDDRHALRVPCPSPGGPAASPTPSSTPATRGGNGRHVRRVPSRGRLWDALERALLRVRAEPGRWRELQRRGMHTDFSWARSAPAVRRALRARPGGASGIVFSP